MNAVIFVVIVLFGVMAYRRNLRERTPGSRRRALAWAWGFWGAVAGSFFGVAGFGNAVPGTLLGAVVGYLGASAWLKVDPEEWQEVKRRSEVANSLNRGSAAIESAVASADGALRRGSPVVAKTLKGTVLSLFKFALAALLLFAAAQTLFQSLPQRTGSQTTVSNAEQQADAKPDTEYAALLAALEAKYPRINPDSKAFDAALTNAVADRLAQYVAQGMSRSDALSKAVSDFEANMSEIPPPYGQSSLLSPGPEYGGHDPQSPEGRAAHAQYLQRQRETVEALDRRDSGAR